MKKQNLVSLTACSIVAAATLGSVAHAADNPFAAKQLQAGYQLAQADKKTDGKCGEAKCGADKKDAADKKESVDRDALVIPSNCLFPEANLAPSTPSSLAFSAMKSKISSVVPVINGVSPGSSIRILLII